MNPTASARPADLFYRDYPALWEHLERLAAENPVVIDRPKGSHHPRYPELVYPLDYGYLEGTTAGDGDGIDVWVGSQEPQEISGLMVTVDLFKRDAEVKILLGCTPEERETILDFVNGRSLRAVLLTHPEETTDLLRSRRSVRRFLPQEVPERLLRQVLEAATWAPSAHNRQPWRFAVLASGEAKARLADRMGADFLRDLLADGVPEAEARTQVERSRRRIREAPAAVVACLDPTAGDRYPDPDRQRAEYEMGVQSVAMAGQNLLLAAHAAGLGAVWVCAPLFAQETVRRALGLPDHWVPQGLVFLGYPAKTPAPRARRPVEDITRFY